MAAVIGGARTLPGVPVPGRPGGIGPVVGSDDASAVGPLGLAPRSLEVDEEHERVGFAWKVTPEALCRSFGLGPVYRWTLMDGHVLIDSCPGWHLGALDRCEHVEDMERLSDARESLRRMGASDAGRRP